MIVRPALQAGEVQGWLHLQLQTLIVVAQHCYGPHNGTKELQLWCLHYKLVQCKAGCIYKPNQDNNAMVLRNNNDKSSACGACIYKLLKCKAASRQYRPVLQQWSSQGSTATNVWPCCYCEH